MFYSSTTKSFKRVVIVLLGIFLAFGIYVVVSINNYLAQSRELSVNYYCNEAQIPSFTSRVDRLGIIDFRTGSKKCLESRKCENTQALINQLPYGFSDAVTYGLSSGNSEKGKDVDGKEVTRYYIPEQKMPLDSSCKTSNLERYYCILRYSDGSCRFAIIVDIIDPDR
ncbi:MAG: hypothetical protein IKO15_09100 [Clostridiales bacterium]|nr:hypothetical protein [Clostridiales bacterium]